MPSAEARIDTEHASRYLTQLCQHVTSIYAKGPALMRHRRRRDLHGRAPQPATPPRVEWTETHGTVSFCGGTLTLRATPGALIVRADADAEQDLQHAQELSPGCSAGSADGSSSPFPGIRWTRPPHPARISGMRCE